jgi:TPR repeat protein
LTNKDDRAFQASDGAITLNGVRKMFFNKDTRVSARVYGHVLNSPLYDADCSEAAREYLAAGDVAGAIADWQRLANLGSARARCVLAYLHLRGSPSIPADLDEAKRIASSAITGERGYANYLLGCFALKEGQVATAVNYLGESHKAGFPPALTAMALLMIGGPDTSTERCEKAVAMFQRAMAAGHLPAGLRLIQLYRSGKLGFSKRVLGNLWFPAAFIRFLLASRYHIFAMRCFQYVANTRYPLFNEESISRIRELGPRTQGRPYLNVLRWTHSIAALIAALVLGTQHDVSDWSVVAWAVLGALPYGVSYLAAASINSSSRVATVVQSAFMLLITVALCDTYIGHLFGSLNAWALAVATLAAAILLLAAAGWAANTAQHASTGDDVIPPFRARVLLTHVALGAVAAVSCFVRPDIWHLEYFRAHGLDVLTKAMIAALPYGVAALFAWRLVSTYVWKPWAYMVAVIAATVLAVGVHSGAYGWPLAAVYEFDFVIGQMIAFVLLAEWALDGNRW